MHPPQGEPGGPKSVRVCDACLRVGQTFDFKPSSTLHPSSRHARWRQNQFGGSDKCLHSTTQGHSLHSSKSFHSLRGLRNIASIPSLQSLVGSPTVSNGAGVAAGHAPAEGCHRRRCNEPADRHACDYGSTDSPRSTPVPCAPVWLCTCMLVNTCMDVTYIHTSLCLTRK